ncbi:MAG: methyltransferase domain-containing protein [Vicinamibacterales bacterium]
MANDTRTLELEIEEAVRQRYARAARATEAALCCPVAYDPALLHALPEEVIDRDYGCGDPSRHLHRGDTVLDLGSGSGKICFIASQLVGPSGAVIGIDVNDEMLAVARRSAPEVARRIGYANVRFGKARIQDLALDLDRLDRWLAARPIRSSHDFGPLDTEMARLRTEEPLVADASVDAVVSNCVLNLVRPGDKAQLFAEIFRVLRPNGRAIISDIVSDEDVPAELRNDPELWTGCLSGALREDRLLDGFAAAGFYGITIAARVEQPWRTVEGIEFRSITVVAYKGKDGACLDHKEAVIYRGPFREVRDDDGHVFGRGVRTAVCRKTFEILMREPYRDHMEAVEPLVPVNVSDARPFPCTQGAVLRDPSETKGAGYRLTTEPRGALCSPDEGCC